MIKIFFGLLSLVVGVTAFPQKLINDPNAEKRTVASFHAIEVGGGIDLFLSQGSEAVAVSASESKYRDRIRTEVVNGVLKIKFEYEKGLSWTTKKMNLKAYVSFKDLDRLSASGGSDVLVDGTIRTSNLDLEVSGGSDFKGKIDATILKAGASGGSDVQISGTAKTLDVHSSGGSDFKGFDLTVENCKAEASGGSDISITATKELEVQSSGGSDVHYKGSAVIKNIRSSGGGTVKKQSK